MLEDPGYAPAKINLALHVTGRRDDGYHLLDSLVVFAGIGDTLSAQRAPTLSLTVRGPFARGVPTDDSNLAHRAAEALRSARGVTEGARIELTKMLPHPAGIGGGSSDAAAVLRLLARLWRVAPFDEGAPELLALGADVPVCYAAPRAARMRGIGDRLDPVPRLPECAMILVNPGVAVPTGDCFAALGQTDNPPLEPLPADLDFPGLCHWIARQRNDLQAPAEDLAPEVRRAIGQLAAQPDVGAAFMSGSGATCVGLVPDMGTARRIARILQVGEMGWWVAPATLLR